MFLDKPSGNVYNVLHMARPVESEKRLELARRAVAVLQREGLHVSITRLADALDVKRPTLLYHFPTRAHIVEAALEDLLTEQAAFVLMRIAEVNHPIEQLYAQVKGVHAFHHGQEARVVFLTQAVAACAGDRFEQIVDAGNRVFEPYRRAVVQRIRDGIVEGSVRPCDPEALVSLARSVIDGLLVQRVMTGMALQPVHEFLWAHVLRPLINTTEKNT